MRWVFAASLAIGFAMLIVALLTDLNDRRMRSVVSAMTAFGIAGLSAAFAGWPMPVAIVVAVGAAGFFGWYATVED